MKNLSVKLFSALFIATTFVIPNVQLKAAAYNSCVSVGQWFSSTATISSPVAFSVLPDVVDPQSLLQAIRGTDNRLYTRITTSPNILSESDFTAWQEGAGITVKEEPEIFVLSSTSGLIFVMSAFGTDNGLYTRTSSNGLTWTPWIRGGSITIKEKPSFNEIQVFNSDTSVFEQRLVQTAYGTDNGLYTRRTLDGITWTPWERAGTITIASSTEEYLAGSSIDGYTLVQFARGTDNGLYSRNTTDAINWSAWVRNSGGITVLDQPVTYLATDSNNLGQPIQGKILQFVRGTDKGIYFRSSVDALNWSNWFRLGNLLADARPEAVSTINRNCGSAYANRVYVKGIDKKLYAVENTSSQSSSFGFSDGLDWEVDTNISLGNNISVVDYITFFSVIGNDQSQNVQSARGTDNKLYTRIITSNVVG
jgi:hypothetical protein